MQLSKTPLNIKTKLTKTKTEFVKTNTVFTCFF